MTQIKIFRDSYIHKYGSEAKWLYLIEQMIQTKKYVISATHSEAWRYYIPCIFDIVHNSSLELCIVHKDGTKTPFFNANLEGAGYSGVPHAVPLSAILREGGIRVTKRGYYDEYEITPCTIVLVHRYTPTNAFTKKEVEVNVVEIELK